MLNILLDSKLLTHGRPSVIEVFDIVTRAISRVQDRFPFVEGLRIIVCTDIGKSDYRLNLLPTYKSGRAYGCPDAYAEFKFMYLSGVIPLFKKLGATVIDVPGLEADDQASIISHILPKDDIKVLVTDDRDWYQIPLSTKNTYVLSPRNFTLHGIPEITTSQGTLSKAQFIAKKCIRGDAGDAIKPAATLCGEVCYTAFIEEVYADPLSFAVGSFFEQLEFIKSKYLEYLTNPKHKVHKNYAMLVDDIGGAWDLNVRLGMTMVDLEFLQGAQLENFIRAVVTVNPIASIEEINSQIQETFPTLTGGFGGAASVPLSTYLVFKNSNLSARPVVIPND